MGRSPNETVPRQFRLTEETLALLDRISGHFQLGSRADAIRLAARMTADQLPAPVPAPEGERLRKKTRKTA